MKVSVIIPAYNASKYIERTLQSVFDQTYPKEQVEIIVVNDGSIDNTPDVLKKFNQRITVITTENKGVSHARNTGLQHATGDFIQYLDSDDLLMPEKIAVQVQALVQANGDVAYGNWDKFTEKDNQIHVFEHVADTIKQNAALESLGGSFWCPPAVLLYSRKIIEKIGPWKEWLPIIQDARYFFDAGMEGGIFVYTNRTVAQYRQHTTGSLSTISKLKFERDVFNNIKNLFVLWHGQQLNDPAYLESLRELHFYSLQELMLLSRPDFEEASEHFIKRFPNYKAKSPVVRSLISIFGIKRGIRMSKLYIILNKTVHAFYKKRKEKQVATITE